MLTRRYPSVFDGSSIRGLGSAPSPSAPHIPKLFIGHVVPQKVAEEALHQLNPIRARAGGRFIKFHNANLWAWVVCKLSPNSLADQIKIPKDFGQTLLQIPKIPVSLNNFTGYPNRARPTKARLDLTGDIPALEKLHNAALKSLTPILPDIFDHDFEPYVQVAHIKNTTASTSYHKPSAANTGRVIMRFSAINNCDYIINELQFIELTYHKEGRSYRVIESFPLAGSSLPPVQES